MPAGARPRGAEMETRQPRIPGDTGRERAARLGSPPAPHTRPKMAAGPPPSCLSGTGHILVAPTTAASHSPSEWMDGGPVGNPAALGPPSQPVASVARLAAIFSRGVHVDIRHQRSRFWGICEPLKFGLRHSGQSVCWMACHTRHTVPVLGKNEEHAVWATKPAEHHPAKMASSAPGSRERRGNNCPNFVIFKAVLVQSSPRFQI